MKVANLTSPKNQTITLPPITKTTSSSSIKCQNLADLKVISQISNSRFPVFLVYSQELKKKCALKVYPYEKDVPCHSYLNELRFHFLSHPNVISMHAHNPKQKTATGEKKFCSSCILIELAPYGDFTDLITNKKIYQDQTLVRTFFRQLIEGIEYLHQTGVAHIDIKLDNILLGEDQNLKIADFDLAYIKGDKNLRGKGTCNYRAPELKDKTCSNPKAADIFSAAVVLFAFKTGGYPYLEDVIVEGYNLFQMVLTQDKKFWDAHEKIQKKKFKFDDGFKELFFSMAKMDPDQRATISQIKQNSWYNGPVYSQEEISKKLAEYKVQHIESKRR